MNSANFRVRQIFIPRGTRYGNVSGKVKLSNELRRLCLRSTDPIWGICQRRGWPGFELVLFFAQVTGRGFAVTLNRPRNRVLDEFSRSNPEASSHFFRELEPVTLERGAVLSAAP